MDESVRATYLTVMILIDDKKLDKIRKSIRYFARKNRKNLHMFHATHGFKRKVLKEVMSYDLEIVIIEDLKFRFRSPCPDKFVFVQDLNTFRSSI